MSPGDDVSAEDVARVRAVVAGVARLTPVLDSWTLGERAGGRVVLKAENLQRAGSFKIRGATAKLAALGELPADVTMATPAQIRDLVDCKALPLEAMATLDAVSAAAGTPIRAEVERMLEATAEALAACIEGADAMQPKFGE